VRVGEWQRKIRRVSPLNSFLETPTCFRVLFQLCLQACEEGQRYVLLADLIRQNASHDGKLLLPSQKFALGLAWRRLSRQLVGGLPAGLVNRQSAFGTSNATNSFIDLLGALSGGSWKVVFFVVPNLTISKRGASGDACQGSGETSVRLLQAGFFLVPRHDLGKNTMAKIGEVASN